MGAEVVPLKREDFYTDAVGVDSDGVRLRVVDRGPRDGVPVLMLHGWPDSAWLWRNQADPMTKAGFRLLIPDQRGFGGSDRPIEVEAYTPSNLIADALAVLDHAGLKRAHVVGHDWGAAIAWSMAAHLPERVISLTALWVGHPAAFLGAGMPSKPAPGTCCCSFSRAPPSGICPTTTGPGSAVWWEGIRRQIYGSRTCPALER